MFFSETTKALSQKVVAKVLVIIGVTVFDSETQLRFQKKNFDSDTNSDSEKFCLRNSGSDSDSNEVGVRVRVSESDASHYPWTIQPEDI